MKFCISKMVSVKLKKEQEYFREDYQLDRGVTLFIKVRVVLQKFYITHYFPHVVTLWCRNCMHMSPKVFQAHMRNFVAIG